MMKLITKLVYLLLAASLTFGSINPFTITDIDEHATEQHGFSPYIIVLCILLSLFDPKVRRTIREFKWEIVYLLLFDVVIFIADISYDFNLFLLDIQWIIKLVVLEIGFITIASYFINYPKVLKLSMDLYQWFATLIIIAYFAGFLSNVSRISNGRLWIFGLNPNTFSFMMFLGALIALAKLFLNHEKNFLLIFVDLVSVFSISLYVVLSGSRGTFIFGIVSVMFMLSKRMLKNALYLVPVVIILVILSYNYLSKNLSSEFSMFERLSELREGNVRENLVERALNLFSEKPLFGFGDVGYRHESLLRYNDPRDSHMVLTSVLAMGGVSGFVFFTLFLLSMFNRLKRNKFKDRLALGLFVFMILISFKTGWVIAYSLMWYVYALAISHNHISRVI